MLTSGRWYSRFLATTGYQSILISVISLISLISVISVISRTAKARWLVALTLVASRLFV